MRSFAGKCGVSEATIRQYIKGSRKPASEQLMKIAEANNVSVSWLLGEENAEKIPSGSLKPAISQPVQDQEPSQTGEETSKDEKQEFYDLCSARFRIIFDFIAEEYGTDSADIENWLDDYKEQSQHYRHWRHEDRIKKRQQRQMGDGSPEVKTVNNS